MSGFLNPKIGITSTLELEYNLAEGLSKTSEYRLTQSDIDFVQNIADNAICKLTKS